MSIVRARSRLTDPSRVLLPILVLDQRDRATVQCLLSVVEESRTRDIECLSPRCGGGGDDGKPFALKLIATHCTGRQINLTINEKTRVQHTHTHVYTIYICICMYDEYIGESSHTLIYIIIIIVIT